MSASVPHHDGEFAGPTEVSHAAAIDAICELRASVWRETGDTAPGVFPAGRWSDEYDAVSRHWTISRDGWIVAAARLSVHDRLETVPEAADYLNAGLRLDGSIAAPARVVVAASARRHGLAARLLDVQDEATREAEAAHAVRQASPAMARLLERRGWRHVAPAGADPRFPGLTFRIMTLAY